MCWKLVWKPCRNALRIYLVFTFTITYYTHATTIVTRVINLSLKHMLDLECVNTSTLYQDPAVACHHILSQTYFHFSIRCCLFMAVWYSMWPKHKIVNWTNSFIYLSREMYMKTIQKLSYIVIHILYNRCVAFYPESKMPFQQSTAFQQFTV